MSMAKRAAGLLLALACAGGAPGALAQGTFVPGDAFCPAVVVLPVTGSIAMQETDGGGRAEPLAWRASLDSASITCLHEKDSLPRRADIAFTGIAESDGGGIVTGMLPIFVSLVSRDNVLLEKRLGEQAIVLTPEMNRIAYGGDFRDMPIPVLDAGARAGLRFVVGFQLNRQQLDHNRQMAAKAAEAAP